MPANRVASAYFIRRVTINAAHRDDIFVGSD